jgi:hypothetical protein
MNYRKLIRKIGLTIAIILSLGSSFKSTAQCGTISSTPGSPFTGYISCGGGSQLVVTGSGTTVTFSGAYYSGLNSIIVETGATLIITNNSEFRINGAALVVRPGGHLIIENSDIVLGFGSYRVQIILESDINATGTPVQGARW